VSSVTNPKVVGLTSSADRFAPTPGGQVVGLGLFLQKMKLLIMHAYALHDSCVPPPEGAVISIDTGNLSHNSPLRRNATFQINQSPQCVA
jgi:hypothetical protein